ncbi:TSC complex subunit 1a isoform X2 [Electrophorus electricus]|uniref:TSC complex subunit 1a isoform X2 n=1 Tax=Electrophorus electricus TaxID=8005 RepID=UPI0015D02EA2|nr:TSC complex subunit 1a isoform X2 [Electrophorus electricus]
MAKDQTNVIDLLPLLESTDLHELEQVRSLLQENLSTDKGYVLLNGLVDYYLDTSSPQAADILSSVREPHDKHLLDKMNECLAKPGCRLPTLTLLGHVVRRQPPWIHRIARFPLLTSLLKCLKSESDVLVLITGVLVLIVLLPVIPQTGKQLPFECFDIFGRLAAWNQRNPGHAQGVYAVHLHASVYSLFHRLYGMYPCNFVSYLRAHYSMKENVDTFEEVVKPMLQHVRIHPELVTGTKDCELDPIRWKRFETHDIVIECAKVSLDPKEASCEEGYSFLPEYMPWGAVNCSRSYSDFRSPGSSSLTSMTTVHQSLSLYLPHLTVTQDTGLSPQTHRLQGFEATPSGMKEVTWSPSSVCGLSTPPSSRGMSPTTVTDLSHSASHLSGRVPSTPVDGKSASTPSGSSPLPSLTEELEHTVQPTSTTLPPVKANQEPIKELKQDTSTCIISKGGAGDALSPVLLTELPDFVKTEKEREEEAITEELLTLTRGDLSPLPILGLDSSCVAPDAPFPSNPCQDTLPPNMASTPDRAAGSPKGANHQPHWSLWPGFTPIESSLSPNAAEDASAELSKGFFPYEPLFDLALPKLASLFVGRRTAEARRKAEGEREQRGELEGEDLSATSPLEVLDRLIQQGQELHEKVSKRSTSLSNQSAELHSGGVGPGALDEQELLRSQLLLLHGQLLYERHKREQHAVRNRRLLRRVINATALEEQNTSMKAQLRLQEMENQALRVSLQEEQQRSKQVQQDADARVQKLHDQLHHLQQERNDYYTQTQELQRDLQESQKNMGKLEAKLQRANNKVCNAGHLLSQLSIKLENTECMEQQVSFLNKQLLLLGEANRMCVQEVQQLGPEAHKELKMLQACSARECERFRQSSVQQSQKLEAAQQRIIELEAQLAKKEHLILEQKKLLENVKSQAKGELQASENRYLAQKHMTQALQSELLQMYSQLEINNISNTTPAGSAEHTGSPNQRSNGNNPGPAQAPEPGTREQSLYMCVNGDLWSGSLPPTALINGSQEEDLSVLSRNSSLAVDSYPSARSFLGMHNQELVKKRKSQCEEELAPLGCPYRGLQDQSSEPAENPPPRLGREGPATQATEPAERPEPRTADRHRARAYNIHRRRQQDLRIMDYNEALQEQT